MGFSVAKARDRMGEYIFDNLNVPLDHSSAMKATLSTAHRISCCARRLLRFKSERCWAQSRLLRSFRRARCTEETKLMQRTRPCSISWRVVFDKGITMSDLKGTLDISPRDCTAPKQRRFSAAPIYFTEPSAEMERVFCLQREGLPRLQRERLY
jgi:phenylalanyl-tRNA synthetase alpha subunit